MIFSLLHPLQGGLGDYNDFNFAQVKAENTGDAVASTRLSNAELGRIKKLEEVPNHFGVDVNLCHTLYRLLIDT